MIRIFQYTFTLITIVLLSACAKEENQNNTIPYASVIIDIQTQIENEFNNPFYSKSYPNAGYGGVIAISSNLLDLSVMNIFAYDMCCPYEAPQKNKIQQILDNRLHAQCPKCKTVYNIANGTGKVISGPGTQSLKSYRVMREGYLFRVRN
ncbi:hypothetical protein CLV62_12241 [Dysgonomonas alginatilytica]|uniref:Rieske domain-containing protein n=1 Tax=Dysgonomonas alginatilytica TaxID=1605892 RepID=A0A2V3PKS7_9BACT|nr:hypothetical protein [Dysgonomonas alginatilytica]PXV62086.1 hypothetical protein CLV62_12241 [Dysgonomonas alginatilytica]